MHMLIRLSLSGALVAVLGVTGTDALGAELEGAIQYPPPSIGEGDQPHRRPECCHSPYRRGASNWVSAGRACCPARNDFTSVPRSAGMHPEHRLRAERRLKGLCQKPAVSISSGWWPRRAPM